MVGRGLSGTCCAWHGLGLVVALSAVQARRLSMVVGSLDYVCGPHRSDHHLRTDPD